MTATAFDTADLEPLAAYKLLIGLIVPRPIAWIGTTSETGVHNLAPFSFFNAVAATPPTLLFSPLGSPGQPKDTLANIRATGQFTHNVVSEDLVEAMNTTAGSYEHGVDEFEIAQLTPIPGDLVAAPRVLEAKASMECRLVEILEFGHGSMSGNVVVGEVVRFHLADGLVTDGRVDPDRLGAIGRMAGMEYARTSARFTLVRPP